MKKIIRVGLIPLGGIRASVYCRIRYEDGNLGISGVVGPLPSGNCRGGCGQIDGEFAHRNPEDNDPRFDHIHPQDIKYAKGWDKELWYDFLDIWKKYHLNNLQAGCEHQRKLKWTTQQVGKPCPTCGYKYGSKWLRTEVPREVVEFLRNLPDADQTPAWV